MNDYTILENLFKDDQDEIHFDLFKESNVIKINDNNGDNNNFDNGISFNTQSIESKMINYKDAYVLLRIECEIPFDETDQGKKSIRKLLYLKNSFEIVKSFKVQLNNVTILNESNINRSALIDRIYFWNISRQIKDDIVDKFINILTGLETASCEVYVVFKTSASITMKYSKNDKLIVYKSQ